MVAAMGLTGCFPSGESNQDEEKDPHFQHGRDLVNSQEFKGAVDEFEKALETNPHSSAAHYELGCLYDNKVNDFAAAIYHYQRYLALAPKSPRTQRVEERIRGCKLELASTEFALPNSQSLQQAVETLTQKNLLLQQQLDTARNAAASAPGGAKGAMPTNSPPAVTPTPIAPALASAPKPSASTNSTPTHPAAPPPVPQPATAATETRPHVYVIQAHDTINSVATRFGLKPSLLLAANPSVSPTRLRVGQSLNLP
jgi:LysM repeat protein